MLRGMQMSNHPHNNHNHSNNNHSHNNSHSYNSSHSSNNQHNNHYRRNHLHNNNQRNNRWQSHSNKSMSKEYDCSKPSNNSNKNKNNNNNHSCSRHNHNNRLSHNPFFSHKAISPAPRAFLSDMSNPVLSPALRSPLLLKSTLKSTLPLFPSNPILSFPRTLAHPPQHAPSLLCQQERDLKMKVARSKWQSLNARKSKTNHLPPKSKKLRKSKKLHRE